MNSLPPVGWTYRWRKQDSNLRSRTATGGVDAHIAQAVTHSRKPTSLPKNDHAKSDRHPAARPHERQCARIELGAQAGTAILPQAGSR